jgi:succinate-acetate transporter protein
MATNTIETPTAEPAVVAVANPAPLGLCAFALTTFVLSCANAKLYSGDQIVLGLALFYGGLAQLCAGMWEFKTGNTFGATAFSSYGAFWMAFAATVQFKLVANTEALGFFLLAWTIFTFIMFLASFKTSGAVIVLFGFLTLTFLALAIGAFMPAPNNFGMYGGYLGIITALIAWYTALAGLLTATKSSFQLPIGPRS